MLTPPHEQILQKRLSGIDESYGRCIALPSHFPNIYRIDWMMYNTGIPFAASMMSTGVAV